MKKKKDEWYLICVLGLGDIYIVCALANELLKQRGGVAVNVFVKNSAKGIPAMFPAVKGIFTYDPKYMRRFFGYSKLRPGRLFYGHFGREREIMRRIRSNTINGLDAYKILLGLQPDSRMARPVVSAAAVKAARTRFEKYSFPSGRTVILCPEANSARKLDPLFWELLADELKKAGWKVVVNAVYASTVIPGAAHFQFSLEEAIPMADLAGWVISLRSGLCDLVSFSKARLSILYPAGTQKDMDFMRDASSSLADIGLLHSANEYFFKQDGNYTEIINNIITRS